MEAIALAAGLRSCATAPRGQLCASGWVIVYELAEVRGSQHSMHVWPAHCFPHVLKLRTSIALYAHRLYISVSFIAVFICFKHCTCNLLGYGTHEQIAHMNRWVVTRHTDTLTV